jgi:hypothetical protein
MTITSDPAVLRDLAKAAAKVRTAQARVNELIRERDELMVEAADRGQVKDMDASKALGLVTVVDRNGRLRAPAYWKRLNDARRRLEASPE